MPEQWLTEFIHFLLILVLVLLLATATFFLVSCATTTSCVTPDGRVFSCSASGEAASTWEFPDGTKASIDTKSDSLIGRLVSYLSGQTELAIE